MLFDGMSSSSSAAARLISGNWFENNTVQTATSLVELSSVSMSDNVYLHPDYLDYHVRCYTSYEDAPDGVLSIGLNYWGTADFEVLNTKLYDSHDDAGLATLLYSMIYTDAEMASFSVRPPVQCHDVSDMTAGCTVTEAGNYIIPRGLYYSKEPIVLRHEDAQLVIEAGTKIMFAEGSSLQVDKGILKIVGAENDTVQLASTSQLLNEYGVMVPPILETETWAGVSFGPLAVPANFSEAGVFAGGSMLQHCLIVGAGLAADESSVFLDHVSIEDSPGAGLHFHDTQDTVQLQSVEVKRAASYGIQFDSPSSRVILDDVTVRDCTALNRRGLYIQSKGGDGDVSISNSAFYDNAGGQAYINYNDRLGTGNVIVSSR